MECPDSPNYVFYKWWNVVKYVNFKIADYLNDENLLHG